MLKTKKHFWFFAVALIVAAGFFLFSLNQESEKNDIASEDFIASLEEIENLEIINEEGLENVVSEDNDSENQRVELVINDNVNKLAEEFVLMKPTSTNDFQENFPEKLSDAQESTSTIKTINLAVPFTTQAPLVNWSDPRQQDGCEEAVSVMAMAWVKNEGLKTKITPAEFESRILALSDFQEEKYGEFRDTSLSDIEVWIFRDYFSYNGIEYKTVATTSDIISELEAGHIVLLPMAGRELKNPNFKALGPLTHMILVKGYDYQTKEFITNDPGTRLGADYRYPAERIYSAIWVYPTGYHQETSVREKAMLVVFKS